MIWFLILFIASSFSYPIFRIRIKGIVGEQIVAWRLSLLPKAKYRVINNLVLKVGDKTSQIDHLIISNYGLFVIETKSLKGWIFGYENSEYWTQIIFRRKERFYNPIRQNRGHIKALQLSLDELHHANYISIVAFSGNCSLKVETDSDVVYASKLTATVRSYSEVTMSESEKDAIFAKIAAINISRTYNRSRHIQDIRKRVGERKALIDKDICPHCGGELINRKSANGRFRGCSNFPECRFTTS